jgi:hypothetical protein
VLHLDVGTMTLAEFRWAVTGWGEANGVRKQREISDERLAAMGVEGFDNG